MPRRSESPPEEAQSGVVNAAARTLAVVECLSDHASLRLEDLSRLTNLAKPTARRFLITLETLGYARRDERDRWSLTLKTFRVGARALDSLDLLDAARPEAEGLSAEIGETVHLGVREADRAVYVLKVESSQHIRMYSRVGRQMPLHCTALGKVLLAWETAEARAAALGPGTGSGPFGDEMETFTPRTIRTRAALESELAAVRARGWAADDGEFEPGVHCVGAPVFDREGRIVAALSASWPDFRWDASREAECAGRVTAAACRISAALGHSVPRQDQRKPE